MRRRRSPFEHIQPPFIIGEVNADMIRNEIEDQAEVVLPEHVAEAEESILSAEFGIELIMIDDVVTVGASGPGLEEGRTIHVADAERLQIGHDSGSSIEVERLRELQTIGGGRN